MRWENSKKRNSRFPKETNTGMKRVALSATENRLFGRKPSALCCLCFRFSLVINSPPFSMAQVVATFMIYPIYSNTGAKMYVKRTLTAEDERAHEARTQNKKSSHGGRSRSGECSERQILRSSPK